MVKLVTKMPDHNIIPLKAAIGLYKEYGFKECEPYYNNPMADVIYMMKDLSVNSSLPGCKGIIN